MSVAKKKIELVNFSDLAREVAGITGKSVRWAYEKKDKGFIDTIKMGNNYYITSDTYNKVIDGAKKTGLIGNSRPKRGGVCINKLCRDLDVSQTEMAEILYDAKLPFSKKQEGLFVNNDNVKDVYSAFAKHKDYILVQDFAKERGIDESTVFKWRKRDLLDIHKLGTKSYLDKPTYDRLMRVNDATLSEFIESNKVDSDPQTSMDFSANVADIMVEKYLNAQSELERFELFRAVAHKAYG